MREQRIHTKENDALKKKSARNTNQCQDKVFINCKKWRGPYTSIDELEEALKKAEDHDICIEQELVFYRLMHIRMNPFLVSTILALK